MLRNLLTNARDLAPIVIVIGFFQLIVLQQPLPNIGDLMLGMFLVLAGLTLFIRGLDLGLFPLGESMAHAFARIHSRTLMIVVRTWEKGLVSPLKVYKSRLSKS